MIFRGESPEIKRGWSVSGSVQEIEPNSRETRIFSFYGVPLLSSLSAIAQ